MNGFISTLFKDPILLASALVLGITFGILGWALTSLQKLKNAVYDPSSPDPDATITFAPATQSGEPSGLLEARLQDISAQLSQVNQRLSDVEQGKAGTSAGAMEEILKRIDLRLEHLAEDKSAQSIEELARIEAKLEGIHKLLILLTEGSAPASPDQK